MKNILNFLDFVEIKTKTASMLPFLTGLAYVYFLNSHIDILQTFIFLIAMLLFDMSTTAINNYIDAHVSKTAKHFSDKFSISIIITMILLSALLGCYLTYVHGIYILAIGMFCFAIGIFYTFGPAPISRTPYGELFSGSVMGFCIPFLTISINLPKNYFFDISFSDLNLNMIINLPAIIKLGIMTLPIMACISNVMLANNICDVESDILIKRFTLPFYIGKEKAVNLFAYLYYIAFIVILFSSMVHIVPRLCVFIILLFPIINKNIQIFKNKQVKIETFSVSIKNLIIIVLPYSLLIAIGSLIGF